MNTTLAHTMRQRRPGQELVEFTLVIPLLFTMIFGIIELSFVFYQDHTVQTACRLAARQGAVGATDAAIRTFVKGFCTNFSISDANIVITVFDSSGTVQSAGDRTSGNDINVQVTHKLMFLTMIQTFFQRANLSTVTASSQFVIE